MRAPRRGRASASARARHTARWCRSHHRSVRRPTRPRSMTRTRRSSTSGPRSRLSRCLSRSGPPASRTPRSRSSRRPPSSLATRASSRPRPSSSPRARGAPTPSRGPSRSMPCSSRRSEATSPSGWPTCATSALGPSQRCSAFLRRACRTSPSRASSSRRTSRRPRRQRSTAPSSSASSPRRAVARATPRSSPHRWASRPSCSSRGRPAIVAGTHVALDGDTGEVTIEPDLELVEQQRARAARRTAALGQPLRRRCDE